MTPRVRTGWGNDMRRVRWHGWKAGWRCCCRCLAISAHQIPIWMPVSVITIYNTGLPQSHRCPHSHSHSHYSRSRPHLGTVGASLRLTTSHRDALLAPGPCRRVTMPLPSSCLASTRERPPPSGAAGFEGPAGGFVASVIAMQRSFFRKSSRRWSTSSNRPARRRGGV